MNLSGIDDSAYIRLNGTQRGGDSNSARAIDLNDWTQPGNNDLEVVLYNNELTQGSLQFDLMRNGALVGHDNFSVNSPICVGGCWYTWRFVYNDTTGAVSQIGSNPPR
ncbi:MAG: hypothetical protein R3C27_14975 [Hyphomonadaceae bacterium]